MEPNKPTPHPLFEFTKYNEFENSLVFVTGTIQFIIYNLLFIIYNL